MDFPAPLVHEVFRYYVEKAMDEFDQLHNSDIAFPDKIKQIIFTKKETASQIHEDFYQYLMKEYTTGVNYIKKMYVEKIIPRLMDLFNEGKKQGYVDPSVSNEAILFFIQAVHEYIQREDVYQKILPLTEDIMRLLFYGIVEKKEN